MTLVKDILGWVADYWWLVPLVGVAAVAYRLGGWRGLVIVATLGLAGALWTEGGRHERRKAEQEAAARRLKAKADKKRVDDEVANLSPDDHRDRLSKWVRDD